MKLRGNWCSDGRRFGWQSDIYPHCFSGFCFHLQLSWGSYQTWPQWMEYPLTSTSDFGGGEINVGERGVHKLGIFLRILRGLYRWNTCTAFQRGFNAYSKRKFYMDVKFASKKRLKSTWKACENDFGCAQCSHMFFTSSWSLFVKTSTQTIRFFDHKPSTERWWRSRAYYSYRERWSTLHWKNFSSKEILVYLF